MRVFCAVMLVLSIGLYVTYAQDKKDAPKAGDQAERLKALKKKYNEELDEFLTRFQKAETNAEKKGIRTEVKELSALTAEKVRKIAEDDPKSDAALDAADFALAKLVTYGGAGADVDKLLAIVGEHHLSSPKVKGFLMVAGRAGKGGDAFLRAAAEKSADKDVRGLALYVLGSAAADEADDAPTDKAAVEQTAKAVELLEKAAKEAPDAKLGEEKLGAVATADVLALKSTVVGGQAPDIEGTDVKDGKKLKLSGYKGKVVLVDVWATWCGPCRGMIPHEREMVKKLDGKPFVLVSVSADDEKETLTKFLDKEKMPWVHWWDGEQNPLFKKLRVKAFPTLYLIDAKGVVRKKWIGAPDPPEALEKAVDELVKEASARG